LKRLVNERKLLRIRLHGGGKRHSNAANRQLLKTRSLDTPQHEQNKQPAHCLSNTSSWGLIKPPALKKKKKKKKKVNPLAEIFFVCNGGGSRIQTCCCVFCQILVRRRRRRKKTDEEKKKKKKKKKKKNADLLQRCFEGSGKDHRQGRGDDQTDFELVGLQDRHSQGSAAQR
jgi:hypothetical protein